jgi:serine protease Do
MMKTAIFFLLATGVLIPAASAQRVVTTFPGPNAGSSYVGVMMQEVNSDRAKALKLPEEAGVEVTRVEPESPAERAGLKPGDVIMQYNGERVEGIEQFSRLVRETPVGREVKLEIFREGSPQTVTVKVAARRASMQFPVMPTPPMAPMAPGGAMGQFEYRMPDIPRTFMIWRSSALGIECETLEGQLADYFGVKQGVLVRSVSSSSPAAQAGIRAGDVITRIDDAKVATPSDLLNRVRTMAQGNSVTLTLMRDHKEMTVKVSVPDGDRML